MTLLSQFLGILGLLLGLFWVPLYSMWLFATNGFAICRAFNSELCDGSQLGILPHDPGNGRVGENDIPDGYAMEYTL